MLIILPRKKRQIFGLPKNEEERNRWLAAISSSSSTEYANNTRQQILIRTFTERNALPTLFECLSKSLWPTAALLPRKTGKTNSSHMNTLANQIDEFNNIDKISSLSDIKLNLEAKNTLFECLSKSLWPTPARSVTKKNRKNKQLSYEHFGRSN